MKSEALPPVPCPPGHYWRQFRIRILPSFGFLSVLALSIWLWGKNLTNPMVVGQVEAPQVEVAALKPGRISKLNVVLFQEVKVGDIVAVLETADPMVASNTVAKILAEMNLLRVSAGLDAAGRVRLADFRLTWMIRRAELAVAQARLHWAQIQYDRVTELAAETFANNFDLGIARPDLPPPGPRLYSLASPSDLDIARRDRDEAAVEVEQKTLAVGSAEKALRELDPATVELESPVMRATLAVAEQELRLAEAQLAPIILTAPMSGRVSRLDLPVGSIVLAGVPILTIASSIPDRITGFLGQPLRLEPEIGMKVEVRSRGLVRRSGAAQVVDIGPRIVLFDAPLRVRGMGAAQERGLPVVLNVPANMSLRPGELVDLRLLVK